MSAVLDLASPAATAARRQRMEAAAIANMARIDGYGTARDLIRRYEVRTPAELLCLLQTVHAAVSSLVVDDTLREYAGKLLELTTDLDADLNGEHPEPDSFGRYRGKA